MIKPELLWNFIKTCEDNEKVGRVCRTLGRQKVDGLTEDEWLLVRMIDNDSDWMDERIEEKKARDRERKHRKAVELRERRKCPDSTESTDSADSTESTDSAPIHPSIQPSIHPSDKSSDLSKEKSKEKDAQANDLFEQFWTAYPSTCPRKIDKKKCLEKFRRIVCDAHGVRMEIFDRLMAGLETWKKSDMWTKDGGEFIRAPLVWLNNSSWEDTPAENKKGASNASTSTGVVRRHDNAAPIDHDLDKLF